MNTEDLNRLKGVSLTTEALQAKCLELANVLEGCNFADILILIPSLYGNLVFNTLDRCEWEGYTKAIEMNTKRVIDALEQEMLNNGSKDQDPEQQD